MSFPIDQQVRATITFKDATQILVDPTTVAAQLRDPSGAITAPSVTHDSAGIYHIDINLDMAGNYWLKVTGQGPSTLHIATPWTEIKTEPIK